MEIPASHAGVVKELKVKLGDKVKEGSVVLALEVDAQSSMPNSASAPASRAQAAPKTIANDAPVVAAAATPTPATGSAPAPAPAANAAPSTGVRYSGAVDLDCDVLVLGGGPGGYSAAFRAADLGLKVVVVERYATLGRRVPERRLHPQQGAAARGRRDGRGEPTCPPQGWTLVP
jgi:dihydrolipoamide dehydrogenase